MPKLNAYDVVPELVLGSQKYNDQVPHADQDRQRLEVEEILTRLQCQPGVILADEVGMGKTFVALGVAWCAAKRSRKGPVVIMVPPNLIAKWVQDLKTFCELYLDGLRVVDRDEVTPSELRSPNAVRIGIARHSVDLMKLLDDKPKERCHLIFLSQGAMARRQSDKWVRLALIREALRRHGRGKATRLIKVKRVIHRFMADLLHAIGEQSAKGWRDELWQELLGSDPMTWKDRINASVGRTDHWLRDDPVPESVVKVLSRSDIDVKQLATALEAMPLRDSDSLGDRIAEARAALREVEQRLWKQVLLRARWRSPLLIMDEAHHLKNPATSLARQLQSPESEDDLRTGDGAMARAFDRMLFLTATPFQLGHQELVRVLARFGDIRWDKSLEADHDSFEETLRELNHSLTESQRSAISLQRCWTRLLPEDGPDGENVDRWWDSLQEMPTDRRSNRQQALLDAFENAAKWRALAELNLRPWVIRHNKGEYWSGTSNGQDAANPIQRRQRIVGVPDGDGQSSSAGIEVPPKQLLPFFLAARSAATPGKDLLGEALCSSYEAFRHTREHRQGDRDEHPEAENHVDLTHSAWYLQEFDAALELSGGLLHPKVAATVHCAVDLWEAGEKVLVFAFYRRTCGALRKHISDEIERRTITLARDCFQHANTPMSDAEIEKVVKSIQGHYFDDSSSLGRRALDHALYAVLERRAEACEQAKSELGQRDELVEIMRRFLRVRTTLVRCFPIHRHDILEPFDAVSSMLDKEDGSGHSWRSKFATFIDFLIDRCSKDQRRELLDAAMHVSTAAAYVKVDGDDANEESEETARTLPNVRVATGETKRELRSRLMRAFNTPFFPDIFVCSEVMGEGVDLQRYCRYVIHHDLAWNPSQIEQRTGRIDRLGCKAENRHPIYIYLPYLAGASDERQFRVMSDREQWFRIVMGQDEVAKLIPDEVDGKRCTIPNAFSDGLSFHLDLI